MTCQIKLLGTSFTLKTDEDPEYVKQVVWYLKKKIEETQQNVNLEDNLKVSILTGIALADEVLKLKNSENGQSPSTYSKIEGEVDDITLRLIEEIDQVLTEE